MGNDNDVFPFPCCFVVYVVYTFNCSIGVQWTNRVDAVYDHE